MTGKVVGVAVLGATGSIGSSALAVVSRHPERFRVVGLTANRSAEALESLVSRFSPRVAVVADPTVELPEGGLSLSSDQIRRPHGYLETSWVSGRDGLVALACDREVDVVVNALVGAAGLEVTIAALSAGKRVALANKESLVAGGALVTRAAEEGGGELVPVDSEHSAILQCLEGRKPEEVARVVLTASGGPFRGQGREALRSVTPGEALQHPTWSMGSKISIDSATLANKALEVIEAHYLYGIDYDRIEAVIHPQSIVHSFVEFVDGSVLSQMGEPNMELPILYSLVYPERVPDHALQTFNPVASSPLTFEPIDHEAFPMFGLGVEAGRRGGVAPAVYNAANEVAVQAFLEERIDFLGMADVVRATLDTVKPSTPSSVADVLLADREARQVVEEAIHDRQQSPTPL